MIRLTVPFLLLPLAFGADLSEFRMRTTYGDKFAARAVTRAAGGSGTIGTGTAGSVAPQREVTVFAGDDALPQMANGDGWKTQIFLVNLSTVSMPFQVDFWTSAGGFWQLAITGVGTGDQLTGTLGPGASVVFETSGQGALAQGWGELTYDTNVGRIGGFGVFRQSVAGRPDFEAVAPLSSLFDKVLILPYDNTGGFTTGVACVNGAGSAGATITATIRDEAGATYATDTIQLPASGHTAFTMPARVPATAGRRGTVVFRSSTSFFSALGLRFSPGGAFTSFNGLNTVALLQ